MSLLFHNNNRSKYRGQEITKNYEQSIFIYMNCIRNRPGLDENLTKE